MANHLTFGIKNTVMTHGINSSRFALKLNSGKKIGGDMSVKKLLD